LLGSGTFGQVYLGFNSESGQFCAIKEVQVIMDDPHSKERLKQLNQVFAVLFNWLGCRLMNNMVFASLVFIDTPT
jgi:serine/threonine protein kinase